MKKLIVLAIVATALFLGWQQFGPKKPIFRQIANMKLDNISSEGVVLRAEAIIHNPNIVPIKVTGADLNVFVNGKDAGKAITDKDVIAEGKPGEDFSVPVIAKFKPGDILRQEGLGGLLGFISGQDVAVLYKGTVEITVLFVSFDVEVAQEATVKLNN